MAFPTLNEVVQALAAAMPAVLDWQQMDPQASDYGAPVNPAWGTDDPSAATAAPLIAACGMLYLHGGVGPLDRPKLLAHMSAAVEYLLRFQRDTGFIDLKNYLPDSAADTAFVLQPLCAMVELARRAKLDDPAWTKALQRLEVFIRRAASGMPAGGFGTPNHRWVICSAMAHATALFPDLQLAPAIDAIVAEGIDIDREGFYMERSVGVYDAVSNRSLLLLADFYPSATAAAREAVHRNLDLDLHLLHADMTAETALSHRQDYGKREVPVAQGSCYLHSCLVRPNAVFAEAARVLWNAAETRTATVCLWYYYLLSKFGEPASPPAALPQDFSLWLPDNGLWRIRRNALSASVLRGSASLLSLVWGEAELAAVKICQTYYGTGRFRADTMSVDGQQAMLRFEGDYRAYRPGAFMPLGRPIPNELGKFWGETASQRKLRSQPKCTSTLQISEVPGGFDLHYRTLSGLDRVCTQVTFDFAPGGVWETADTACRPRAGDELFLRQGVGRMIYGTDVIEIGPGTAGHRMWQMRDSELAPHYVRVTIALVTPIDQVFRIRLGRGIHSHRST